MSFRILCTSERRSLRFRQTAFRTSRLRENVNQKTATSRKCDVRESRHHPLQSFLILPHSARRESLRPSRTNSRRKMGNRESSLSQLTVSSFIQRKDVD